MTSLSDPAVTALLEAPNHAVLTTVNEDGSLHSTVVWQDLSDGEMSVNGALGRLWPANIDRNPTVSVLVMAQDNPYEYVEVRGRAEGTQEGADEHINRLAKKYIGVDEYPFRAPGEQRVLYRITPDRVRYQKQG
jgi:PPOX class probable F420-dependent enzyme